MPSYTSNNLNAGSQQALTTVFKTILSLNAQTASLRRGKVYDILIGTDGTPADQVLDWDMSRMTGAGTATSTTPNPNDPADTAALSAGFANYTAEPTVTASSSVFAIGVNQRASYRWVAAPGNELVFPATNLNGLVLRARSPGYTGTATGQLAHLE